MSRLLSHPPVTNLRGASIPFEMSSFKFNFNYTLGLLDGFIEGAQLTEFIPPTLPSFNKLFH